MNKYEQLIEAIISEDDAQAKELFHQIVVEKSRDIYESLMDEEMSDDETDAEELADDVEADEVSEEFDITSEEAKSLMDYVDSGLAEGIDAGLLERVSQYFGVDSTGLLGKLEESSDQLLDIAYGNAPVAEEEHEEEMSDMDMEMPADDAGSEEDHHADVGGNEEIEDRVMDLESALDDLKAEFDALMSDDSAEEEGDDKMDMDDEEGEEEEMAEIAVAPRVAPTNDLDIMREYVEKVNAPKGGDNGANAKSVVPGKNDMGGTTANIVKGGSDESGRAAPKAAAIASGNRNVPGGKADSLEKAPAAKKGE
tara:strand:- start:11166 stop:12095 length:930 start_codon:yes stop_codon:yes gene_type:complete